MNRYALISVSDKRGVAELARALAEMGIGLLSTGGTARFLQQAGVEVIEAAHYTGFPEILDGRVKTLHPRIHAGILADRARPEHLRALAEHGIAPIDLVVVNLYPFAETIAKPGIPYAEAIEQIDIGGPALIRAAAKNHGGEAGGVAVLTDPADYERVLEELKQKGAVSAALRRELAAKAFAHPARYDALIRRYLYEQSDSAAPFPPRIILAFERVSSLRYGENPHQPAALYRSEALRPWMVAAAEQLQGKELSYNNYVDADAAWQTVRLFDPVRDGAACVIIKHATPCGVGLGASALQAYERAFEADPESAFGGILAFNLPVDAEAARALLQQFAEVIIAPDFREEALALLATKKNLRLLKLTWSPLAAGWHFKPIEGGLLVQGSDPVADDSARFTVQEGRMPLTHATWHDLLFAWRVAARALSNAIVVARDGQTLAIGSGQTSRVEAVRQAIAAAKARGITLEGAVAASDGFFPFRDSVDLLAEAGIAAIIQPGGSLRDDEVLAAAREQGIAMILTHTRHFRHG